MEKKQAHVHKKSGVSMYCAHGGITVFLTGILFVFLTFILTCVKAVRIYAIRVEAECVAEMGMDSVFAEYNRELLEQYDLFFIDTTYGYAQPSYQRTEAHLSGYIEANLHPQEDLILWNTRDFLGLELKGAELIGASLATDDTGLDVKYQAVEYMRDKVGLELIEDIQRHLETVSEYEMDSRDVEQEAAEIERQIHDIPLPYEQLEDGSFVEAEIDNPADSVNSSRFKGILYLVVKDTSAISKNVINPDNYVSHRECNTGSGAAAKGEVGSAVDEILFGEYLIEKCSYYGAKQEGGELSYELEYILAGKSSDMENLKWVAGRLIMIREVANLTYLYTDKKKVGEADALAWGLSIVALKPQMQPLIKNSLLFAWAYAESVQDVKILLSGGKVPLLKTADTWHLSLDHMLDYKNHLKESGEEGIDYAMYLRLLLMLTDPDEKVLRFMDVVEMNLRKTEGNEYFRMDGCIDAVTAFITISGRGDTVIEMIKEYSYLNR